MRWFRNIRAGQPFEIAENKNELGLNAPVYRTDVREATQCIQKRKDGECSVWIVNYSDNEERRGNQREYKRFGGL
jgi:hypothetical protein